MKGDCTLKTTTSKYVLQNNPSMVHSESLYIVLHVTLTCGMVVNRNETVLLA